MNIFTMMYQNSEYRKGLDKLALLSICSCLYYDFADNVELVIGTELINIINSNGLCQLCLSSDQLSPVLSMTLNYSLSSILWRRSSNVSPSYNQYAVPWTTLL